MLIPLHAHMPHRLAHASESCLCAASLITDGPLLRRLRVQSDFLFVTRATNKLPKHCWKSKTLLLFLPTSHDNNLWTYAASGQVLNLVPSLRGICFPFREASCYYVDFLPSCTWSEVLAHLVESRGHRWRESMLFNPPGAMCWMQNKPSKRSRKTLIIQSHSVSFSNWGLDNGCLTWGIVDM